MNDSNHYLRFFLARLLDRQPLDEAAVEASLNILLSGEFEETLAAGLLVAWRSRGETPSEIAAAVRTLRKSMVPLTVANRPVLDTCGTGGDDSGTFNISTATALVVAGAGIAVVKHGNRSVSSKSGSADVLAEMGVPIQSGPEWARQTLEQHRFAFCFAPQFHPALAKVAPLRRKLGVRTIFNLLGPLLNPAGAEYQLIGVGKQELLEPIALALHQLGLNQGVVLHSRDGMDEISLAGPTEVKWIEPDGIRDVVWQPIDFGLPEVDRRDLLANGPAQSAQMIRSILENSPSPAQNVVLANAAAALLVAGQCKNLVEGVAIARESIHNGNARAVLEGLIRRTEPSLPTQEQ